MALISMSRVLLPLLSPAVVGRAVFRLASSEINSRALLRNGYFTLINRKKMKQEPSSEGAVPLTDQEEQVGGGGRGQGVEEGGGAGEQVDIFSGTKWFVFPGLG